jgi:hypothetical protein
MNLIWNFMILKKPLVLHRNEGARSKYYRSPWGKKRLMTGMAWAFYRKKHENIDSLFAIYYNNTFPRPYKNPKVLYYFDPDGGLLVSESFWNFPGKSKTTYTELLKIFREFGKKNKKRIWDGFSRLVKEN